MCFVAQLNRGIVVLICLIGLFSCGKKKELKIFKMSGAAQGTYYAITYCADNNENLQPAVDSLLKQFDKSVSAYVPTSILSRLNNNDSNTVADSIYETVFKKSRRFQQVRMGHSMLP